MRMKIKKILAFLMILTFLFSLRIVDAATTGKTRTPESYANFRNVQAGKIGMNNLYRGQHPANGSARSHVANRLSKKNGIKTVLNLADSNSQLLKYFKKNKTIPTYYYRTLYDNHRVYTASLSVKHKSSSYRKKLGASLKFMAKHNGPYLVHCNVGRDRTGFVILVLECLMGAPYSYMLNDYALSLENVNGYSRVKSRKRSAYMLNQELHYMTGKKKGTNWYKLNLVKYAEIYLRKCGMSPYEIKTLKQRLSVSYPES